ncbi:MAG TPA: oligosaccharide flippase family protein [Thermoanaerobaculia bacterium]|nr:oligosaccharide flippase family protein [Thermoanaerobaculia bacterium]
MPLTTRHAREMAIVFVAQAGSAFAALAAVKLLTALLPPSEYGYTAIVTSYVVAIVTVLAAPGSGAGQIMFHEAVQQGHARRLLGTLFVTTLVSALIPAVLLTAARPIETLDRTRSLGGLVACGLLYLAAEVFKAPVLTISGAARWRGLYATLMMGDGWGKLLLIAAAAGWLSLSARTVIIAYAINSAVIGAAGWLAIFRAAPHDAERRFFSKDIARATIRHGWFFAGIGAAGWLINLSDRVLLSTMVPAYDVGIYVAGYQAAAILPVGLSALITGFMSPILLQKQAADPAQATQMLGRVTLFTVWVLLPATVVTISQRDLLLRVLTSGRYAAAAPVVLWIAPALALLAVNNATTIAFWMTKRINQYFFIAVTAGVLNVVMNLVMVPRIGFIAAAISTFATYAVQMTATIVLGRRHVRWRAGVAEVTAILAGTAALVGTLLAFTGWLAIGVALMAYAVISVGVFLLLDADGRHALARFREEYR